MALKVVDVLEHNDTTAVIVIESDHEDGGNAYTELQGPDCRRLAIMHAAKELGLSQPGVNNVTIAYPVDKKGKEITDQRVKFHRFRADISVTRRIA